MCITETPNSCCCGITHDSSKFYRLTCCRCRCGGWVGLGSWGGLCRIHPREIKDINVWKWQRSTIISSHFQLHTCSALIECQSQEVQKGSYSDCHANRSPFATQSAPHQKWCKILHHFYPFHPLHWSVIGIICDSVTNTAWHSQAQTPTQFYAQGR